MDDFQAEDGAMAMKEHQRDYEYDKKTRSSP
jgi:hypothetical protein